MKLNQTGTKVHMIGIGGVSMSPLAQVLNSRGLQVTGSDGMESLETARLEALGISVSIGHEKENLGKPDFVIRTAAVHDDNPEVQEARKLNIPVYERAQGWGELMKEYKNSLCIAGTHGKTTTTAMCSHIFLEAEKDPTIMLGGVLPSLGAGHHIGTGDTIIAESCEYCNSFHHFFPTVAVILNVEEDHLDFFHNLKEIKASFHTFGEKVPDNGMIIVCGEDENAINAVKDLPHLSFGIYTGDIHTENLSWHNGLPTFDLIYLGEKKGTISLEVPGFHNVMNAIAAASASLFLGVEMGDISKALKTFTGAGRRLQHKGEYHGAVVMDDYAHHPTELVALFTAVKKLNYKRIICAFQPHTFTRTKAFLEDFAQVLLQVDQVLLLDIYAAREPDTGEVSSKMLADKIPQAQYTGGFPESLVVLQDLAQEGDLILTVGAGDVFRLGEMLVGS